MTNGSPQPASPSGTGLPQDTTWATRDGSSHPITGRNPIAATRLVTDFTAPYLKFHGREPRTLEELAIVRADLQHRNRLAEIRAMAKKLPLLQEHLAALQERGIRLADRTFYPWDNGKVLSIQNPALSPDDALHTALLDRGFKEIERKTYFGRTDYVTLKHGRALVVRLEVSRAAAAPTDSTAAAAQVAG